MNPGKYTLEWVRDEKSDLRVEDELPIYLSEEDKQTLDLNK